MRRGIATTLGIIVGCAAAPEVARANGGNSHAWISMHAIEHLPDGELKRLLARPALRGMLVNGSVFPDGGYVVDDDYGEMAHWEPFVEAYVRWMRDALDRPFTEGAAAEHTAFLMGVASHGMADQVFDATFMDAARGYDAAGWSDELLDGFDTATDVMLVADTMVSFLDVAPWVPAQEVAALYRDALGYEISASVLDSTQELLHRFVLNFAVSTAMDAGEVREYQEQYPWAAANLMDPGVVGSPPCEGEVVADYWLAVWDRLHDASGAQNYVIATSPRASGAGHPTDYSMVEAQVVIVFGSGVRRADLAGQFEVRDSTGRAYELDVDTQWGAAVANLVRLRPMEDWAEDETFTVTVRPGLTTIDGLTLDAPWSFTFSTTPTTAPPDPTGDPTPHTGEPDIGRAPSSGGCRAPAAPTSPLALLLALLALRRVSGRSGSSRPLSGRRTRRARRHQPSPTYPSSPV